MIPPATRLFYSGRLRCVPEQTPTFTRRVARSFQASLGSLQQTGEAAVIALVAAAPWLISLTILALPILGLTRWSLRRGKPVSP